MRISWNFTVNHRDETGISWDLQKKNNWYITGIYVVYNICGIYVVYMDITEI